MGGNTMNPIRQNQSVSNTDNRLYRHRTCRKYVTMAETDKQTVRDWKITLIQKYGSCQLNVHGLLAVLCRQFVRRTTN